MIGPRGVAEAIADHLLAELPGDVTRLAEELGPATLPGELEPFPLDAQPRLVASAPIATTDVGIDDWPFLVVIVRRMRRSVRVDVGDDGSQVFERIYPVRVFGWARGDGYHLTAAVRDRLILAIVECLLRTQVLGEGALRVESATLTEEYSDVGVDDELAATVAAGYAEFDVVATETLTPRVPPAGVAETAGADTQVLPPHPALG